MNVDPAGAYEFPTVAGTTSVRSHRLLHRHVPGRAGGHGDLDRHHHLYDVVTLGARGFDDTQYTPTNMGTNDP